MSGTYLWSGLGLIAPLHARVSGELVAGVHGISIDTRTLEQGDLFFAIKGDNSNGHDYVARAFEKGAAACVVDEDHAAGLTGTGCLFIVRDVLAAMENLGRAARARSKAKIIAVTGSAGKTSTKEALRVVLAGFGVTHASLASYNNHWGVPLSLARMPANAEFGIFEIGMNHADEITPLVAMVQPHVAIVTTVAPVHLEHFASLDAIADAKAEVFSGLVSGGVAIINADIPQWGRLTKVAGEHAGHIMSFGEADFANLRMKVISLHADYSDVIAQIINREVSFRVGAPGKHLAMNALAVLGAAKAVGVDVEQAATLLAGFAAPKGRGERHELAIGNGSFVLIDESYNANPASMRAALALLGAASVGVAGRRIAVLGDMLELGPQAATLHSDLVDALRDGKVDQLYAAGPMMKHLFDAVPDAMQGEWHEKAAELQAPLFDTIQPGDVVMVKGSNGSRMGPLVAAMKEHFIAPSDSSAAQAMVQE